MTILSKLRPLVTARAATNVSTPPLASRAGTPEGAMPVEQPASPVFLTPQSLVTFPGASLAINVVWNAIAVVNRNWATAALVPMVVALLIGGLIYWVSLSDQMGRKERVMGLAIAVVNSLWLGLNALNVNIINPPTSP
jgi:hypothetical protein